MKKIIRDIVLLNTIIFLGEFFIGFFEGLFKIHIEIIKIPRILLELRISPSEYIFYIIGFSIIGCNTYKKRFSYLRDIAILQWLSNALTFFINIKQNFLRFLFSWLFQIILISVTVLIGDGISILFVPNMSRETNRVIFSIRIWFLALITAVIADVIKDLILSKTNLSHK